MLAGRGGRQRTIGVDLGAKGISEQWIVRRCELGLSDDAPLFPRVPQIDRVTRVEVSVANESTSWAMGWAAFAGIVMVKGGLW